MVWTISLRTNYSSVRGGSKPIKCRKFRPKENRKLSLAQPTDGENDDTGKSVKFVVSCVLIWSPNPPITILETPQISLGEGKSGAPAKRGATNLASHQR